MELYLTLTGKVTPESANLYQAMFGLMVDGKTGAPLENYVAETFPAAEDALERLLDDFEESGHAINLETYQLKGSSLELNFMGSYDLQEALPLLTEWLAACGVEGIKMDGSWV